MRIYIKIGTMPAQTMHLCNKRKEPVLGEEIYVKSENYAYIKKERVIVDEIRHLPNGPTLYCAYRM